MIDYIIIGLLAVAVILLIAVLIKKGGKDNSELRIEMSNSIKNMSDILRDTLKNSLDVQDILNVNL